MIKNHGLASPLYIYSDYNAFWGAGFSPHMKLKCTSFATNFRGI